jgi:hypothetical protein
MPPSQGVSSGPKMTACQVYTAANEPILSADKAKSYHDIVVQGSSLYAGRRVLLQLLEVSHETAASCGRHDWLVHAQGGRQASVTRSGTGAG